MSSFCFLVTCFMYTCMQKCILPQQLTVTYVWVSWTVTTRVPLHQIQQYVCFSEVFSYSSYLQLGKFLMGDYFQITKCFMIIRNVFCHPPRLSNFLTASVTILIAFCTPWIIRHFIHCQTDQAIWLCIAVMLLGHCVWYIKTNSSLARNGSQIRNQKLGLN